MSTIVLGADGYLGWSLVAKLATSSDKDIGPIVAVDDLSKRRRVEEWGYGSAIPVLSFAKRIERLRAVTGRSDIIGVESGVEDCIFDLVKEHKPRTLVHLAQIPSAPYSMKSFAQARETLVNNEASNLAVLFALREHAPQAHLVKMGSMGEYARVGVDLGEGYVDAVLDGEATCRPIPFPRESEDVYHVTKINDTNFISMACRVWGLAVTDVMQSIVYGVQTSLSVEHPDLTTRFDCDPVFGSVLNRFVAQAVAGVPLTVHAGGTGTTGLIALQDVMAALTYWVQHPASAGEHRVINQATETRISIMDIALLVQRLAADRGIEVTLNQDLDPRHERSRPSKSGPAKNFRLRETKLPTISLEEGVRLLLDALLPHKKSLPTAGILPNVDWKTGGKS